MTGQVFDDVSVTERGIAFIGRNNEVSALSAALTERQSRLIVGEAGVGKTRLLQESLAASGQTFLRVPGPLVLVSQKFRSS